MAARPPRPTCTAMTSRPAETRTLSISGNAGGSIRWSSSLDCSIVRSLTCWPATLPSGVTPNSTRPPRWLSMAHMVAAASRRVPVEVLNSSDSDSPAEISASICPDVMNPNPDSVCSSVPMSDQTEPLSGFADDPHASSSLINPDARSGSRRPLSNLALNFALLSLRGMPLWP